MVNLTMQWRAQETLGAFITIGVGVKQRGRPKRARSETRSCPSSSPTRQSKSLTYSALQKVQEALQRVGIISPPRSPTTLKDVDKTGNSSAHGVLLGTSTQKVAGPRQPTVVDEASATSNTRTSSILRQEAPPYQDSGRHDGVNATETYEALCGQPRCHANLAHMTTEVSFWPHDCVSSAKTDTATFEHSQMHVCNRLLSAATIEGLASPKRTDVLTRPVDELSQPHGAQALQKSQPTSSTLWGINDSDLCLQALHFSFDSDIDRTRKLLEPSKIAKEVLHLVQTPLMNRMDDSLLNKGYLLISRFAFLPDHIRLGHTKKGPRTDLRWGCEVLRANDRYATLIWIKSKWPRRVKNLVAIELLEKRRKAFKCDCKGNNFSPDWYEMSLEDALIIANKWIDWMDQEPYSDNGDLKSEYSSGAVPIKERMDQSKTNEVQPSFLRGSERSPRICLRQMNRTKRKSTFPDRDDFQ